MERAIDLMVSDEICELFPAMTKLDDEEEKNKKEKKLLLGVNKSSSIDKKKIPRPDLKRNVWGVKLSKEKKEEMKKIEDELQGGRDYIGVSSAPPELVSGKKMQRFKAEFTNHRGRRVVLGTHYKSAKSAALAHDVAAVDRYGLAVRLNFPHRVNRNDDNTNTSIGDQSKGDKMVPSVKN